MFDKIVWSIGFFNSIVNSCLILDNYDIPITYKNVASISCDFSILLYGVIVPVVYYNQIESWKKRVEVIMVGNTFCSQMIKFLPARLFQTESGSSKRHLRTRFGISWGL
uniref:7TM_GPCR_Srx domain-containing protein n=1 Tax=Caenorhabditis tropicalis TaxID=1561998 RepID=A0A1I7TY52_9PELO